MLKILSAEEGVLTVTYDNLSTGKEVTSTILIADVLILAKGVNFSTKENAVVTAIKSIVNKERKEALSQVDFKTMVDVDLEAEAKP
ncbi:hypothetical protein MUP01_04685 [Candidatus Bathyarchaeota archaeon]|nr:hypothetical protein [Candidatus Bathyarchaeota archaeon]